MTVVDPAGREWRVVRRLVDTPQWRGFGRPVLDVTDGIAATAGDGGVTGIVVGVVVVVLIVLSIAFVWPLVVLVIQLAVAVVLMLIRFLLGRWTVVATSSTERRTWSVRGRGASARLVAEVADAIRRGEIGSPALPPRQVRVIRP